MEKNCFFFAHRAEQVEVPQSSPARVILINMPFGDDLIEGARHASKVWLGLERVGAWERVFSASLDLSCQLSGTVALLPHCNLHSYC